MSKRRNKRKKSFLELNDQYHIMYYRLLKEAKIWNGHGQYWLSKETENRAKHLLNGNLTEALTPIKSEKLYYNKSI